jgi:serine/threonine protein phosphatase PrpC
MAYYVELQFAAKTDTGLLREHNEDSIALSVECGLAILADGMGGYNAGEIASTIAANTIKETWEAYFKAPNKTRRPKFGKRLHQIMADSVELANAGILQAAHDEPLYSGMGTTVVIALFHHDRLLVAHVGDSRLYRLRDATLTLITRDHSLLQEQIDAGLIGHEEARFSPNRNLITRAVGIEHALDVEVHEHRTLCGDIYLLCSDGLSDMLATEEIAEITMDFDGDIVAICDALVHKANQNGGRDNTSVILVKVQSNIRPAAGMLKRIWNCFSFKRADTKKV